MREKNPYINRIDMLQVELYAPPPLPWGKQYVEVPQIEALFANGSLHM